jgi:plastocyanin
MTRTRSIVVTAAVGLVLTLSGCGNGPPTVAGAGAGAGGGASIGTAAAGGLGTPVSSVQATSDLVFNPTSSSIKAGGVVQWTNSGSVPHNVTFDQDGSVSSQTMQQGDTWQVKFTTAGSYPYHCTFHPGMDGTVTVGG